ncbi:MAG: replication factor C small subunit [Candidatus Woesearchaeota archaeon]
MLGDRNNESAIWTEKYRPSRFDEFEGQEHVTGKVRSFIDRRNMPHLLFSGPAGVGKTTLALIIAKELFGDSWRDNFLELNASDERGIDIIRSNVKDFAKSRSLEEIPFKIIYLDECDALTREAQQALRRTMENYTRTTRFILSCNFSSKIIDPIQSRCAIFRFRKLPKDKIMTIIDEISEIEKLNVTEDGKEALFLASEGDCRRLKNLMQSCASITDTIDEKSVFSLAAIARPEEIKKLMAKAYEGDFKGSRELLLSTMLDYGLSGLDIIKQIQSSVMAMDINEKMKLKLIDKCAQTEFRIVEGSDEFVQLEGLLAYCAQMSLLARR